MSKIRLGDMSIKWKLSFSLIAIGLSLVVSYVLVAKRVFEHDKISYVFESQSSMLANQKRAIEQKIERSLLSSRSLVASFDPSNGKLSSVGEQIFREETSIQGLELWDEKKSRSIFRLEKTSGLNTVDQNEASQTLNQLKLTYISDEKFLIVLRYPSEEPETILRLRVLADLKGLLPQAETNKIFLLIQDNKIILDTLPDKTQRSIFDGLIFENLNDVADKTMMWNPNGLINEKYLVSSTRIEFGNFKLVALMPESVALGALGTLFQRSLLFLAVSIFGLISVSLALARRLTLNLGILSKAAGKIGEGDFESVPVINSQDEMGLLSKAMSKMSFEIQRLLVETKDKVRMETELKTAKLVQERLLPSQSSFTFKDLEVSGVAITSTECGGDWWYSWRREDDLFLAIADATGHGTPAALITAAARAVFSRLEAENLSLMEMMNSWDAAVRSCSQGRVFMTGILMKISPHTGIGTYIGAGHEAPFMIEPVLDNSSIEFVGRALELKLSKSLGEGLGPTIKEESFTLPPNGSIVLYTDGLFSVNRPDGKILSEKRVLKSLASQGEFIKNADDLTKAVLKLFNHHRENLPLPDDVTIVSLHRKGPTIESTLASEEGHIDMDYKM